MKKELDLMVSETDAPSQPRKNLCLSVVEPNIQDETPSQELDTILTQYLETLSKRKKYYIGYPTNIYYEHHAILAPLLQFHLNNFGDPFTQSPIDFHSKDFEVAVLEWFAQLWEIEKDEYWGYSTNGGTEGTLHGLLVGELLSSGILYASSDSHYSVFKAARMYRMELETINTLVNGEIVYENLRSKLLVNKNKPAIININIGTTFKGAIDDLDLVIQILGDCGYSSDRYYIHCDAALCGLILPYIRHEKTITFKKSIGSISVSGHKFLGCPMPCGIQITRKRYVSSLSDIEYIASIDTAIMGGRNGLTAIFLWYSLSMKGHAALQQDSIMCIENARYLKDRLLKVGISVTLNEFSIIVIFERPRDHKFIRQWKLCYLRGIAHLLIMSGITRETIDSFINDLMQEREKWYQNEKTRPPCLEDDFGSQNCLCCYKKMYN
ncbi:histidine decarboxylase-like [Solanum dulcamara]|uniref:histidine decarboxylase-like n=1 Tax=Solanum dulcamara TaxID=45834 RepID=UPI002485EDEC|nr:histidine decarboxylase-like [Solanum dulcamara]